MKRLLFFTSGILVSASLGLLLGRATYAISSSEDLISALFADAGLTENNTGDVKELEGLAEDDEGAFQNLYLFMFQNVVNGPSESALEALATRLKEKKRYGYNVDELREIVLNGSLVPILDRRTLLAEEASNAENLANQEAAQVEADAEFEEFMASNSSAQSLESFMAWYYAEYAEPDVLTSEDTSPPTQQDILAEYQYLLDLYEQELQLQRDYRQAGYEALATEMFYNGDLNDSAKVDLLYDLDLAYLTLFGETISFPDRTGTDAVDLASEESSLPEFSWMEDDEENLIASENDSVVVLAEDTVNPYTCYDDASIQAALDAFYAEQEANPTEDTETTTEVIIYPSFEDTDEDPDSSGGGDEEEEEDPREEVDEALQTLEGLLTNIGGPKGDWTRSLPCGEVFCITIDLISETEDPTVEHEESDNCIACHLSYINQRMNDTVNSSLVPSKVSMNWFEDATCKEAGNIDLDFNIFTVAMPIDLDPGDDIDEGPAQSIEDLRETLISIGEISLPDGQSEYSKTLEDLGCESILNLEDISGNSTSLGGAVAMCQAESARIQASIETAIDESLFEAKQSNATTLYEQVSSELSRMLIIIKEMQEGFQKTYLTDDAPLPSLNAKKYCE